LVSAARFCPDKLYLAFNTKATGQNLPVDTKATEKVYLDRT
jgi:hypothetical protein